MFRHLKKALLILALLLPISAYAADILILTTRPKEPAYVTADSLPNFVKEFTDAATATGGTATLNDTELTNGAAMNPTIFTNPTTHKPYNIVVLFSAEAKIDDADWLVLETAVKQRSASTFIFFTDLCSGWSSPTVCGNGSGLFTTVKDAAAGSFTPSQGAVDKLGFFASSLNTNSPYAGHFTNMPQITFGWLSYFNDIPVNNILYVPRGTTIPIATSTASAAGLFIPNTESFKGNGACVFAVTDGNSFSNIALHQVKNKIGSDFIAASTKPGAPCLTVGQISKSFNLSTVSPGDTTTLTINVNNIVGQDASNLNVIDALPAPLQINGTASTTCPGGTFTAPDKANSISLTGATLPAAGCTITVPVTWPKTTAGITACGTGMGAVIENTITPLGSDNVLSADDQFSVSGGVINTPTSAKLSCKPLAYVDVQKTSTATSLIPGDMVPYIITVSNKGLIPATNVSVIDSLPSNVFNTASWSCTDQANTSCGAGSGNLNQTGLTLPAGATWTYKISATVVPTPAATYTNTVSVPLGPDSVCFNASPSPCTASAQALSAAASIQIDKTSSTTAPLAPNSPVNYTITVKNTSSVNATGITVSDPLPAGIAGGTWTCTGSCGAASGNLPLTDTIANLAPGASTTYTLLAQTASSGLPAQISNSASANFAGPQVCVDQTGIISLPPCSSAVVNLATTPIISALLQSSTTQVAPGNKITYTLTVSNVSAVPASNVQISNPLAAGLANGTWTCVGTCGAANGSLSLSDMIANLPPGATATYTITAIVAAGALPGAINSQVTIKSPGAVVFDAAAGLGSAVTSGASLILKAPFAILAAIPSLGLGAILLLTITLIGSVMSIRKRLPA